MSAKLAKLSREKSMEFKKNRYSTRFKSLKKQCKEEIKIIKQRRINAAVQDGDGSNFWLGKMELLLDPNGCTSRNAGVLPEHLAAGLTRQKQAED